jgi:hypothetical protein
MASSEVALYINKGSNPNSWVAEIVTLCKDSLHADRTLIITGIDANIEYTIIALSHRTGQLIYHR